MRTVDPTIWSKKLKNHHILTTRCQRFGQKLRGSLETRIRMSFRDAITEFLSECSYAGVKYINLDQKVKWQRNLQISLFLLAVLAGIPTSVNILYMHNKEGHDVVTPISANSLIGEITFPAVALCSNTVISKKALKDYAHYLYRHPKNLVYRYNESVLAHNLRDLGALLSMARTSLPSRLLLNTFQMFLEDVQPNYNVSDIMFKFSPPCSSILKQCSWQGHLVPCEDIFAMRITPLGYCCVFNSRYMLVDAANPPRFLDRIGLDHGLGLVVAEDLNDIAYLRRPASLGFEMLIFEGVEFPLVEGGSVQLQPVPLETSAHITLRTTLQTAHTSRLSHLVNDCRTKGYRRMLWCLTECRRREVMAVCNCVPYNWQGTLQEHNYRTCSLGELVCLNKHREKFLYLFPVFGMKPLDETLAEEIDNSLWCRECRPHCTRQRFSLVASYVAYKNKRGLLRNFLSAGMPAVNTSVIRLFYSDEQIDRYRLEVQTRWYEVFVKICSLWYMFTGITVLTVADLLYHCTIRWTYHYVRRTNISQFMTGRESRHLGKQRETNI